MTVKIQVPAKYYAPLVKWFAEFEIPVSYAAEFLARWGIWAGDLDDINKLVGGYVYPNRTTAVRIATKALKERPLNIPTFNYRLRGRVVREGFCSLDNAGYAKKYTKRFGEKTTAIAA